MVDPQESLWVIVQPGNRSETAPRVWSCGVHYTVLGYFRLSNSDITPQYSKHGTDKIKQPYQTDASRSIYVSYRTESIHAAFYLHLDRRQISFSSSHLRLVETSGRGIQVSPGQASDNASRSTDLGLEPGGMHKFTKENRHVDRQEMLYHQHPLFVALSSAPYSTKVKVYGASKVLIQTEEYAKYGVSTKICNVRRAPPQSDAVTKLRGSLDIGSSSPTSPPLVDKLSKP
ncbi:hypothetical protein BU24DRAFT_456751 [Aaosphaeria arxii CBS 175.79]|uniref:Uncharacterized protein n=1 Tax=Aaosphaeria arxii CBS 175.79 TaxID=1450172 RepID=A0A6A5Y6Q8_9PLEO|nr:uncharacterized protein BU24DRAFT_456751 [Aaosphaeria arxii CBS 175.79]KAF2020707.1 hypothetical protein BU24DRAFT_456751 [Aaosphaeria arxii CBS 175.79]